MSLQLRANIIIMCWTVVIRTALVALEVSLNFTGAALEAVYVITILAFFLWIWTVNLPSFTGIKSRVLKYLSCGAAALLLTGLSVYINAVHGTLFKLLIKGSF